MVDTKDMVCKSLVQNHLRPGEAPFPENDGFKYIGADDIDSNFNPDGARVVKQALTALGLI